jgi:hypothetical protein
MINDVELGALPRMACGGHRLYLRMLDIDIAFGREGRSGERVIRMSALRNDPSADLGANGNNGYGIVSTVSVDAVWPADHRPLR